MAEKITNQEDCLICGFFPCICKEIKRKAAVDVERFERRRVEGASEE